MSDWRNLRPAACKTHHINPEGQPAYRERFDEVLAFHPPGLAPVLRDLAAWHINPDGTEAYSRRFLKTFGFYGGIAAVCDESGWHHIDASAKEIYSQRYAWCGNFQETRCTVRQHNGLYCHIDELGAEVSDTHWRYAGDYRDGLAVVQAEDGKSTHVDLQGRPTHGHWFLDLDVYHKGFARARDDAGWMHIDSNGAALYRKRFAAVEPFYNGQARVECFDGGREIISEAGKTLITLRPPRQSEFAALSGDMVGFWKTQTIATAIELGIPEVLPLQEAGIAEQCGLSSQATHRLMRALEELHIAYHADKSWHLTARGEFLRVDHRMTLADAALEYAGPLSAMWSSLTQALRIDGNWKAPDVFGEVAQNPKRVASHHRMLRSYARHDYPAVSRSLGLRGNEHILDAGGGLGTLANFMLDAHPGIKVTVLDRSEVIAQGSHEQPQRDGLKWKAVDLFKPWGVEADGVILSRVLHDWNDADAIQILRHARASLSAGGRLFVVEMLLPEEGGSGGLCDLHLLMATGGEERTASQYQKLLEASGFEFLQVKNLAALPSVLVGIAK